MRMRQEERPVEPGDAHPLDHPPERPLPYNITGHWWQIAVGGAIALVLGLGALQLITILAHPLALLILAISVAAAFAAPVSSLQRWMPRLAAIILVYLVVLLIFYIIGRLTISTLVDQAQAIGKAAPDLMREAYARLGGLGVDSASLGNTLSSQIGQFSSMVVSLPLMFFSSLLEIFLVLVMSIYWLIVAKPLRDFFISIFPENGRGQVEAMSHDISRAMGGYVRATVINGLVIGTLTYIGLAIIGVQYALVLALLAGLLEFIPLVGPIISGLLIVVVALLQSPTLAVFSFVYMFLLQQFEGNILVPNIMRSQTEISPLLVILALLAGNTIGGVLGALVAIPIASALQVFVLEIVVPAVRGQLRDAAE